MSIRRLSNSTISTQGRGKSSNFIASYSPGVDEMDLIGRVTVPSGGASVIDFTSIPGTYQHLQIRSLVRSAATGTQNARLTFNGTTAATYFHQIIGDGATAYTVTYTNPSTPDSLWFQGTIGSNGTANTFTGAVVDILDYTNTSKTKVARTIFGYDANGSGNIGLTSVLWNSTAAITSIRLTNWGGNWAQYTTASLYGVIG